MPDITKYQAFGDLDLLPIVEMSKIDQPATGRCHLSQFFLLYLFSSTGDIISSLKGTSFASAPKVCRLTINKLKLRICANLGETEDSSRNFKK